MIAPLSDDEAQRLDALRRFEILDTPPERAFDDLTRLASQICGTSIALVTFIDEGRQWLKSTAGIELTETPRDISFCAHAILEPDLLVVGDLAADPRFAANPFVVGEPYVRFYAGVPLRTAEGFALGALCVLDQTPRALTPAQADALRALARQVMAQLELRREIALREAEVVAARGTPRDAGVMRELFIDSTTNAVVTLDAAGRFTLVNRRACEISGRSETELLGLSFSALLSADELARVGGLIRGILSDGATVEQAEVKIERPDGSHIPVAFNAAPIWLDGAVVGIAAAADDISERKRSQSLIAAQGAILELVARGSGLDEILQAIACAAERHTSTTCAIFLVEADGLTLRRGAIPTLSERFSEAFDGLTIGPAAASCGTAAYRRAPVLTHDIAVDPLWIDMRELMADIGLRAAWSTPVIAREGHVLATLTLHAREARLPDEWEMRVIDLLSALTGLAIQRARAQQQIVESEARYRALAENAFDLVCELDSEGRFAYVSPNFKTLLGYEPAAMIGQGAFSLIHPEDRERVAHEYAGAIADPASGTIAFRFLRNDATWTWLEVSANIFTNERGEPRAVVVARDASARIEIEAKLRESEERLRAFVENAPVILFALDAGGVFTLCDGAGLAGTGLTSSDFVGRSIADVFPETPQIAQNGWRALGGETFSDVVTVGRTTFDVRHMPVRDDAGAVAGVVGVVIDVTARTTAEEKLRENEEKLRTLVSNAPLILFGTDRDGVFTLFDGKGVEPLGVERGQYVGESIFDAMASFPDITDGARRALAGETVTYLFRGERAALEIHHSPVRDAAGEISGTIGLVINVSERIRAEEELQRSEQRYRAIYEAHRVVRLLVDPATGLIEEANQAASDFYGYTVEEMAGMPIATISTTPPDKILDTTREARDGGTSVVQRTHRLKSGEIRDVELFAAPVAVEGRTLLYGIVQDVTERRWAESLLGEQRQLLEMVAVGAPLVDVLERLTRVFEEHAPGAICSVLLASADGTRLLHAAAPSLPAAYAQAIDGVVIGPAVGSCGTAAYLRREVVVEDIASDPLWADYRDLALEHGLRSCWSTPIFSSAGSVLGTFAVYHREPGGVRARDRELVEIATHVAGIAIERKQTEDAERARSAELERMYGQLAVTHAELEDSQRHLEEKSFLLGQALQVERERSRHDQLTGALNHAAIADTIRELIREDAERSLAIAMVDVDGLKAANDTYGHQVGDEVLVLVAQKLMRDGAIVGRYGGDEFVAILPGVGRRAAEEYRDAVLGSLVGAGLTDAQTGAHIPVVASIGLAVYPEEAGAVDDLIRLSDSAMYASRRARIPAEGEEVASRALGSERAAKMVGEIVPLLTSPGALEEKLRLVAHRLSIGAGYDGVNFLVEGLGDPRQASTTSDRRIAPDDLDEWNRQQLSSDNRRIKLLLIRTMKPILIDDIATTELLPHAQREALMLGGLRSTLIAPMIWQNELIGALSVASKRRNAFTVRDIEFLSAVATQVTAIVRMSSLVEELQHSTSQLQEAHEGTVLMLASAAEAHDHTTGRHLQRVREITEAIARELGYDDAHANALGMAATLHDIGKIRVPDSVLGSSNSLAEAEWVLMKQHTLWGAAFLADQPGFELAASVARHHHERWDGAGYPDGLAGDDIPESALITTVADSFDAMTNNRPYRRGRPVEEAVREIQSCSGTQFSPRVVEALVRLFERGELAFVHPDEDELAAA